MGAGSGGAGWMQEIAPHRLCQRVTVCRPV